MINVRKMINNTHAPSGPAEVPMPNALAMPLRPDLVIRQNGGMGKRGLGYS